MLELGQSVIVRVRSNSPNYRARTIAEEVPDLGHVHQGFLTLPDT